MSCSNNWLTEVRNVVRLDRPGSRRTRSYLVSSRAPGAESDFEDFVARVFLRRRSPESPVAKAVGIINRQYGASLVAIMIGVTPDRRHKEFMMEADTGPALSAIKRNPIFSRPSQQKTANAGRQKMAEWRGGLNCVSATELRRDD
jgi:hypothetical protein